MLYIARAGTGAKIFDKMEKAPEPQENQRRKIIGWVDCSLFLHFEQKSPGYVTSPKKFN
jgi:hypothetical protein